MTLDLTDIRNKDFLFCIMNAPTDKNIHQYAKKLNELDVRTLIRVCEPTYSAEHCAEFSIEVKDFPFADGAAPPNNIISSWLDIVEQEQSVAVHCVAGLGRAPVLVVIALIEYCDMSPLDAIRFVRSKRRGAINRAQLKYLTSYEPTRKNSEADCCCIL